MKTTILLTALFLMCGQASALVLFLEDGEIKDGDNFDYVQAANNAIINVTGGSVTEGFATFGSNTVNVYGGYIQGLGTNSDSDAVFNIYTGANIGSLSIGIEGNAYVSGGTIGEINSRSEGTVNLTGGNVTDYLIAYSTINIYGYGFNYDSETGAYDGGQLTGFWLDGGIFSIDLKNYGGADEPVYSTYDNLNLVPEPATLALLGIGSFFLRRRK